MSPTPRKVRSGRRQFGPSPGTEQEWAKVMASPHIQRAMSDPAIQQAMMQHIQQSAPGGPPEAMAQGGALHFDTGGGMSTALQIKSIQDQLAADPNMPRAKKDQLLMTLATLQAQTDPGPMPLPGGGTASGSTMGGLGKLAQMGPPTLGNMAAAIGMGAVQGAGVSSGGHGLNALLGAGLSGALNYLIRKYGKGKPSGESTSGGGGGGGWSTPDNPNVTNTGGAVPAATATPSQPAASVTIPNPVPPGAVPPGSGGRLRMGTANSASGNVISRDGGKTWVDTSQPDKPYTGVVLNEQDVDPGSSLNAATQATTPPPPSPTDDPSLTGWGIGMAEGGPVEGEPQGLRSALPHRPMALPVLHTTIVISGKPKGKSEKKPEKKVEKKARGGKASLLPPKRGPQDHEDRPRTHGRVQVPRGFGAAIKGKRFGGIY